MTFDIEESSGLDVATSLIGTNVWVEGMYTWKKRPDIHAYATKTLNTLATALTATVSSAGVNSDATADDLAVRTEQGVLGLVAVRDRRNDLVQHAAEGEITAADVAAAARLLQAVEEPNVSIAGEVLGIQGDDQTKALVEAILKKSADNGDMFHLRTRK